MYHPTSFHLLELTVTFLFLSKLAVVAFGRCCLWPNIFGELRQWFGQNSSQAVYCEDGNFELLVRRGS